MMVRPWIPEEEEEERESQRMVGSTVGIVGAARTDNRALWKRVQYVRAELWPRNGLTLPPSAH